MADLAELLIHEVRSNPLLWDKRHEDYKHRDKTDAAWNKIAKKIGRTKDLMKTKWRHLRDVFHKEIRKIRSSQSEDAAASREIIYQGKWAHFEQMMFLRSNFPDIVFEKTEEEEEYEVLLEDAPYGSEENSHASVESENISDTKPFKLQKAKQESALRKNKRRKTEDYLDVSVEKFEEKDRDYIDEDEMFLRSLTPYFKNLDQVKKLRMKGKILNLIADEIGGTSDPLEIRSSEQGMISDKAKKTNSAIITAKIENI